MVQAPVNSMLHELGRLESLRDASRAVLGQRAFNRHVVRGDAELSPIARERQDVPPLRVKLRDASLGGIGFLAEYPIAEQSLWQIAFTQRGYAVGQQAIVVRHCTAVNKGVFLVGAEFIANPGLLTLLGVEPRSFVDPGADADFVPPDQVA